MFFVVPSMVSMRTKRFAKIRKFTVARNFAKIKKQNEAKFREKCKIREFREIAKKNLVEFSALISEVSLCHINNFSFFTLINVWWREFDFTSYLFKFLSSHFRIIFFGFSRANEMRKWSEMVVKKKFAK